MSELRSAFGQRHARAWAANQYGEDSADLFVAWLMALDDSDAERVERDGYPAVAAQFESEFKVCKLCGGRYEASKGSCICFDNGCQ